MTDTRRVPDAAHRAALRLADATPTIAFAAWLRSCEPAWTAVQYGDRDPQVLAQAEAYQRFWCLNPTQEMS